MFLILGHFEKTRMFFQSAFASNKSVSLSLSIRRQKTLYAKELSLKALQKSIRYIVHGLSAFQTHQQRQADNRGVFLLCR